jgi:hypothetical protein
MTKIILRAVAIAALAIVVSSCQSKTRLEYCPGLSSVLDASVITQLKPGAGANAANAVFTAKITNVDGSCSFDKKGKSADSSVDISFTASRPAAGDEAQYTIPYFVAVTQATRIVTREQRSVTFSFAAGATTADFTDHISSVELVTDGTAKPYDYQVLIGFQLTKEQLDYNKSVGIFAQ